MSTSALIAYSSMLLGALGVYRIKRNNGYDNWWFVTSLLLFESLLALVYQIARAFR